MASAFWNAKWNNEAGMFDCPWCNRQLKSKVSNSAKNPGRAFVSCSKDHGGCGLFSFLDDQPNDQFKPREGAKRARSEGTNVIGPVVNQPSVHEQRLAELVAEVGALKAMVIEVLDYLKQ